jgi:hypothetical protein
MTDESSGLYDLLQQANLRPSMFVNDWSLDQLETICYGYSAALLVHRIEEFGTHFNERFRGFLWDHYEWSMSLGWASGIRRQYASNEEAFHRFFELLEEFKTATA